jgi:hypothetical protein
MFKRIDGLFLNVNPSRQRKYRHGARSKTHSSAPHISDAIKAAMILGIREDRARAISQLIPHADTLDTAKILAFILANSRKKH